MRFLSLLLITIVAFACQPSSTDNTTDQQEASSSVFQINTTQQAQWEKDHLQLVPITASSGFINSQEAVKQYSVLSEALKNERFRISEKKPFGRFTDSGAVNNLTVQNKTDEAVFLMAGDVVQGGNQDRVIAEDQIIAARSINDIPVFCVEHGRWTYNEENALSESDKKIYAFRGYYNVASSDIRKSVQSGNQNNVWKNVAAITEQQDATSSTKAYAGLDNNTDFLNKRLDYQQFFEAQLDGNTTIVGFIALSGDHIIGADIFGHPALLNRQFKALINGYATDAILESNSNVMSEKDLQAYADNLLEKMHSNKNGFYQNDLLVHFEDLR